MASSPVNDCRFLFLLMRRVKWKFGVAGSSGDRIGDGPQRSGLHDDSHQQP